MGGVRLAGALLAGAAAGLVLWVRLVPLGLPAAEARARATVRQQVATRLAAALPATLPPGGREARLRADVDRWIAANGEEFARDVAAGAERWRAQLRVRTEDGREYVPLGDYDSYLWLREARTLTRSGTTCEAIVDGDCRDLHTLAPVGTTMRYAHSLHVEAIAALHRLATRIDPGLPLPVSAYWVPVLVGTLGVFPAFAIGRRLAGPVGGLFAAVTGALHPVLLQRSIGSDNDVWNVVLPLYMVWAVIAGLGATRTARQVAWGILAGICAGLHAATWRGWPFGFAAVLAGLAGAAALQALRAVVQTRQVRVWTAPPMRAVLAVGFACYLSAGVCTALAGSEESALRLPLRAATWVWAALAPTPPAPSESTGFALPSALSSVGELWAPSLGAIAGYSYGPLLFFVGWLGLLLLLLPRGEWQAGHFVVLIAGTLLYRFLLTAQLGRSLLLVLLAAPLAAAVVLHAIAPAADDEARDASAAVIVVVWFLAALFLAFDAYRLLLLLAAPYGLTAGVAVGRLHLWLDGQAAQQRWIPVRPARGLAAVAAAALTVLPARQGYARAAAYVPSIDRAWIDTLERLRATTPPDAILNAWWDYGYWIAYFADRRVSADGGTLLTQAPYWIARAQLAPGEDEAVGLLRMLNCGSDATPLPEGARGAFGTLRRHGIDDTVAAHTVLRLAPLSRAAAAHELAALGLADAARAEVLSATHCTPPDSYLVLSSTQPGMLGWWYLGTWDPRRARLAATLRQRPEAEAVAELTGPLGYDEDEARRLYHRAQALDGTKERDAFVAPRGRLLTPQWLPCEALPSGERRCAVGVADESGRTIDAVVYLPDDPQRAMLELRDGTASRTAPALVLVAGPQALETTTPPTASGPTAVLIDPLEHRALLGTPTALRSTYTALMFLDGRYARHFRKVDDRTGAHGERVVTWRIEWPGAGLATSR